MPSHSRRPAGAGWVHEIKHDGYRLIVRKEGAAVRLFTRRGYDWSTRFLAIAAAAEHLRVHSFTIDGEAVVVGPDGLSRFDDLRRRVSAQTAILYAFDLIERDGEDFRPRRYQTPSIDIGQAPRQVKVSVTRGEQSLVDLIATLRLAHAGKNCCARRASERDRYHRRVAAARRRQIEGLAQGDKANLQRHQFLRQPPW